MPRKSTETMMGELREEFGKLRREAADERRWLQQRCATILERTSVVLGELTKRIQNCESQLGIQGGGLPGERDRKEASAACRRIVQRMRRELARPLSRDQHRELFNPGQADDAADTVGRRPQGGRA